MEKEKEVRWEKELTHHGADLACQGKGGVLAVEAAALVEVADVHLNARKVARVDQLVGP